MMLRLVSNGRPDGTRVIDIDTGRSLDFLRAVRFDHIAGSLPVLECEIQLVEVEAFGAETRFHIPGIGDVRAVELTDGTRVNLPDLGAVPCTSRT